MFCSELLTRWYRAGGFNAVAPAVDADHVAPAQFLQSATFSVVWRAPGRGGAPLSDWMCTKNPWLDNRALRLVFG
jgi:hypothetical protein